MLPEHKNPIFVSKRPKISKKSPILTQKCQLCARKAGKWGSRSQKAHKKADFVLGGHHRTARSGSAEHGTSTERPRRGREQPSETEQDRLERSATARSTTKRNRHATQRNRSVTHNATATATPRNRHAMAQQKRRQPFGLSPLKIGGYLLSHMVVQYHRRK